MKEEQTIQLSVVIPAFKEETVIQNTIRTVIKYLEQNSIIDDWEIIVVEDSSADRTREFTEQICKKDKRVRINKPRPNRGKGYSVREGALLAKYDLVLFTDADLSTPINELDHFLELLTAYDVIIGSRAMAESSIKKKQPLHRRIMGRVFNLLVRIFTGLNIKDTQCGFKLLNGCRKQFEMQTIERYSFDVELLYLAKKAGKRIIEVPVVWINNERSKVRPVRDSIVMFKDIIRIRWNDICGRYKYNEEL